MANFLSTGQNRRWTARQKIHTPAYVSVDSCEDGTIFGLNEVFDIGTSGLAFQSPAPLSPGSRVRLNLELSGAGEPVKATGRVIWSDLTGKTGVELKRSSVSNPRRLDEYLFLNAITACSHYQALQSGAEPAEPPAQAVATKPFPVPPAYPEFPDYPSVLTRLMEVQAAVDLTKSDSNHSLQVIAEQALGFLAASGVAIAISDGSDIESPEIVCEASAGSAPGLGARFHSGEGFSGECIKTGALLQCDEAQNDPRVDHDACAALEIRSILAAPICLGPCVIGLIEVFSPQPNAFNRNGRLFVQRLADLIVTAVISPDAAGETSVGIISEEKLQASPPKPPGSVFEISQDFFASRLHRTLLLGASAGLLGLSTLLVPWMRPDSGHVQRVERSAAPTSFRQTSLTAAEIPVVGLKRLKALALAGDADAQFALGAHYATGEDVVQSYKAAARWFSLSAAQGHVVAQATLGAYYWAGRGVPEDLHRAYFWSALAQSGGDEGSKLRLTSLAALMTHAEVIQIQDEADEWIRKHQLVSQATFDPHP